MLSAKRIRQAVAAMLPGRTAWAAHFGLSTACELFLGFSPEFQPQYGSCSPPKWRFPPNSPCTWPNAGVARKVQETAIQPDWGIPSKIQMLQRRWRPTLKSRR